MRKLLVVFGMAFCVINPASGQVSVAIGFPGVSIGINLPVYPEFVRVPGYPVYYAPQVSSNYFFYDGMYWVYQSDSWYASSWYNGPWGLVAPEAVPLYVLRVPVRYFRRPPAYFHGWRADAPPRWGEYWGGSWEQSHRGWDRWDRRAVPAPAPLPIYQRQYSGPRYPHVEQQQVLQSQHYRYQPRDAAVQQYYPPQRVQMAPAQTQEQRGSPRATSFPAGTTPAPRTTAPQASGPAPQRPGEMQQQPQTTAPREPQAPGSQGKGHKPTAGQAPLQQTSPSALHTRQQAPRAAEQYEQQAPRSQGQGPAQKHAVAPAPSRQGNADHKPQAQPQHAAAVREQPAGRSQGQDQDKGPPDAGSAPGRDKGEQQVSGRGH